MLAAVALGVGQFIHEGVPVLAGRELHQNDQGIEETLEVVLAVQVLLKHHSAEEVDAESRVDEEHQEDQLHDV